MWLFGTSLVCTQCQPSPDTAQNPEAADIGFPSSKAKVDSGLDNCNNLLDCLLYGQNSCTIPEQDGEYNEYLNHFETRDDTGHIQVDMIQGLYNQ